MHSCGRAAWPPLPVTSMKMPSLAASSGPGRMANCPTGIPGMLCMPNTSWMFQRSIIPVVDHRLAAGAALLGGLEDDDGRAVEVARLAQILGGAEQHGRVPVVAAGVHLARRLGGVGQAGRLRHRQRIHVGAHADHLAGAALAALDDADHAGPADARHHLVAAEGLELVGDHAGGAMHLVEDLGVLMDVAAPLARSRPAWRQRD